MESYVQELQFEMSEHDIDVLFSNDSLTTLYAKADAEQLRRVLINLTTNSIKFMDKEKEESISFFLLPKVNSLLK